MIIIDTTTQLTRELSIERVASEVRFLSMLLVHGIRTKFIPDWE